MASEEIWKKIRRGTFVIAEIGKNFIETEADRPVAEYLANAKKLVRAAKEAGADAVKFQTHSVEDEQLNIEVISPHFRGADRYGWVKRNTEATPVKTFWKPLKRYCDELGIIFFSTPMSRGAARLLHKEVGVPFWKVGSGDILDFVMLDYLRNTGLPIVLSSGMSTIEEVDRAVAFLTEKNPRVALLHCVSKYPCPPEDLRLKTIEFFRERYDIPIGFSDHSIGIDSALAAAALGATVIEKHFSFARDKWGSDHKVSLMPEEMKELTAGVRALERNREHAKQYLAHPTARTGLGTAAKVMDEGEATFRPFFRKSLMAARDIPAGTFIAAEHLYAMRPQLHAGGIPSERYEEVLGRRVSRSLKKYEPITEAIFA